MTDTQVEAVAKALHNHRTAGDDLYDSWEEEVGLSGRNMLGKAYVYKVRGEARAAIAALDIEKIEREAYERVRRILLSRGVSDYLDEVFMEPEYWDSEHDGFSGKLVHYLNMKKVMSVLVTNWLGDEEIKDFDDER